MLSVIPINKEKSSFIPTKYFFHTPTFQLYVEYNPLTNKPMRYIQYVYYISLRLLVRECIPPGDACFNQ